MKASGQDNTKEFQDLIQKAGEVKKAMKETAEQIQYMAKDTKALSSISEGVQTLVAGFGLWQAAVGLTDKDNQQLTETIKNMQITMSALQSLQTIQNTLQKESNLMTGISVVQLKAKAAAEALATEGTIAATVAQKALNLVANANPYILLATALATVAGAFYLFASGANEAKKAQEALNREMELANREVDGIGYQYKMLAENMRAAGKTQLQISEKNLEGLRKERDVRKEIYNQVITDMYATDEQRKKASDDMLKSQQDYNLAEAKLNADKNDKIREDDKKASEEAKKNAAKAAQDLKEQYDKQTEAIRKAQDTALALVMEGVQKQRDQLNLSATREIEDLQNKLATEKNLTEKAKQAIAETIKNIQAKLVQDLAKLDDQEIQDKIDKEAKRIELMLAGVAKEGEDAHRLRLDKINNDYEAEIEANRQLAEDKRQDEALINAKYDKLRVMEIANNNAAIFDKQKEAMDLDFKQRLSDVQKGSLDEYQIKADQAQAEMDMLINMDEQTKRALFKSENDYTNAVLDAKAKIKDADVANKKAQMEAVATQMGAYATIADAMSQALESFAGNNEELAGFAKAMALFNIALSTGEAIAKGIAAAQSVSFPLNLPAIATTIAAILTNIAKANQIINSSKQPKAPKFAQGGLITGAGSGTSDSVPANLSAGESVMTAAATSFFAPILSAFNQIGGGVPISSNTTVINNTGGTEIGEEMLTRAFEKGYIRGATKFPPVVSIEELTRKQNQIAVMERLSKIGG